MHDLQHDPNYHPQTKKQIKLRRRSDRGEKAEQVLRERERVIYGKILKKLLI